MDRFRLMITIFFAFTICMHIAFSASLFACDPEESIDSPTILELTNSASSIMEGVIDSKSLHGSTVGMDGISIDTPLVFTIQRWFKGNHRPNKVIVSGFDEENDCNPKIPLSSERVILFTKGDLATDGMLQLDRQYRNHTVIPSDNSITADILRTLENTRLFEGSTDFETEIPNFSTQTSRLRIPELTLDNQSEFYNVMIELDFETTRFSFKHIDNQPGTTVSVELQKEFNLRIGQSAKPVSSDDRLTFIDIAEDSRCPGDVNCFWAGQVTVVMQLTVSSSPRVSEFHLTMSGNEQPAIKEIDGYRLELLKVIPYPKEASKPIPLSEYEIILMIQTVPI